MLRNQLAILTISSGSSCSKQKKQALLEEWCIVGVTGPDLPGTGSGLPETGPDLPGTGPDSRLSNHIKSQSDYSW